MIRAIVCRIQFCNYNCILLKHTVYEDIEQHYKGTLGLAAAFTTSFLVMISA